MPDTPTFGRYAEIPYNQMTPEQQEAYRSLIEIRGQVGGPSKIWVHNPKLAKAAAPLGAHFHPGHYSLTEREREIAVCIINSKWHSAYPTSAHERRGKEVGLPAEKVEALIAGGEGRAWVAGRQLIDLIRTFPTALSAEQLRALTRPLAPRAYSIASSRREVGEEAHLLISAVRYASHGRARKGVASNFVAERRKRGDRVRVKLRPNRHFALPAPDRDIIMVGPGTGVAPFRAFVQERRAIGAGGRSWLFFGDRQFTHDFLYQLEWQEALQDGALARMDVAFSRDRPEKIYVQHRMWDARRDLVDWIENGAYFYVCGDAKTMAKDVRATLVRAFADVKTLSAAEAEGAVSALERERRYLQDTY